MQQVNKDLKIMIKYILVIALILFTGCSSKNDLINAKQEDYTSTMNYDMISKDAVLEAAKKAFIFTNKDFVIDSYRNSLSVRKTNVNHFPLTPILVEDTWFFEVNEVDNKSLASVYVKRIKNLDSKEGIYLSKSEHEIFWKRVGFFLSLEANWESCMGYISNIFDLNGFCDNEGKKYFNTPNKEDRIADIFIFQRINSKDIVEINDDILENDNFSIKTKSNDILEKEDKINSSISKQNKEDIEDIKEIDSILDKIKKDTDENLNKQ